MDYFFVNKTSRSNYLSRSDEEEKRSMGAYIQGRRLRVQQLDSHRLATNNPPRTGSTIGGQAIENNVKQSQTQAISEEPQRGPQLHACNTTPLTDLNTTSLPCCRIESIWTLEASGPTSSPLKPSYVPFDTYVRDLLHYFVKSYEPSTRYLETIVRPKHKFVSEPQPSMFCLHDILCNQMETDALLAAMAARIQDIECIDQGGQDLVYSNQAMSAISKSVAGTMAHAPRTFRAIFFLVVAAWHHQDTIAFQLHLKGLKAILDSSGGLESVDMTIRTALIRLDGMTSAAKFERPCFASKQFEIHDEDQIWLANKILSLDVVSATGKHLLDGEHRQLYGSRLHSLIIGLVKYVRILEWQFESTCPCPRLLNLVNYKLDLVRHQLLELELAGLQQHAVRMSILIWMIIVLTSEGSSRSVQLMVVGLRDLLSEGHRNQWKGHESLYFWVLSVGIMAAEDESPTQMYLISEIKRTLPNIEEAMFKSQEDLLRFSKLYLYLHCAQSRLMQKLAKYLVLRVRFHAHERQLASE